MSTAIRRNLLLARGVNIQGTHSHHTLGSTTVQAWAGRFRNVNAVLLRLKFLIIVGPGLQPSSDVAVLKRNSGKALLPLSPGQGAFSLTKILSLDERIDHAVGRKMPIEVVKSRTPSTQTVPPAIQSL